MFTHSVIMVNENQAFIRDMIVRSSDLQRFKHVALSSELFFNCHYTSIRTIACLSVPDIHSRQKATIVRNIMFGNFG